MSEVSKLLEEHTFFKIPELAICSVKQREEKWIIWDWDICKWITITDKQKELIKEAQDQAQENCLT